MTMSTAELEAFLAQTFPLRLASSQPCAKTDHRTSSQYGFAGAQVPSRSGLLRRAPGCATCCATREWPSPSRHSRNPTRRWSCGARRLWRLPMTPPQSRRSGQSPGATSLPQVSSATLPAGQTCAPSSPSSLSTSCPGLSGAEPSPAPDPARSGLAAGEHHPLPAPVSAPRRASGSCGVAATSRHR